MTRLACMSVFTNIYKCWSLVIVWCKGLDTSNPPALEWLFPDVLFHLKGISIQNNRQCFTLTSNSSHNFKWHKIKLLKVVDFFLHFPLPAKVKNWRINAFLISGIYNDFFSEIYKNENKVLYTRLLQIVTSWIFSMIIGAF